MTATTIILVRHGQTEWNRVERFRGRYDIELNSTGLAQVRLTADRIARSWKPAAVFTSRLRRAMQTAEVIARACSLVAQSLEGLLDIDYGDWQGLTPADAREQWPSLVSDWYEHPERVHIPNGESLQQVRDRAVAALTTTASQFPGQTVVMVSHTVVNRLLLLGVLQAGNEQFWNLGQEPCAINMIEIDEDHYFLCSMNDTCHLEGCIV